MLESHRDMVAKRFAEAAGLQKTLLHVDDAERGAREVEFAKADRRAKRLV